MHTRFDEIFRISIILKGLEAALEVIGGIFLFFVTSHDIEHFVHWLTAKELSTDPHDFIATLLVHSTSHLSANSTLFGAVYLLSHGVIKLVVILAVLKNKFWAYPALLVVLVGFMIYQLVQVAYTGSITLILLTVFDAFVAVMTILEWQKQIALRHATEEDKGEKAK